MVEEPLNKASLKRSHELWIYPNLGIGEPSPKGIIEHIHSDKEFLNIINVAKKLGANILGGCCGTSAKHIKLIANHTL